MQRTHENNEAGGTAIPAGLSNTNSCDSDKRTATVQAQLSRKGFVLERLLNGSLLICRWGHAHECDIDGAEAFARRVGAA